MEINEFCQVLPFFFLQISPKITCFSVLNLLCRYSLSIDNLLDISAGALRMTSKNLFAPADLSGTNPNAPVEMSVLAFFYIEEKKTEAVI